MADGINTDVAFERTNNPLSEVTGSVMPSKSGGADKTGGNDTRLLQIRSECASTFVIVVAMNVSECRDHHKDA